MKRSWFDTTPSIEATKMRGCNDQGIAGARDTWAASWKASAAATARHALTPPGPKAGKASFDTTGCRPKSSCTARSARSERGGTGGARYPPSVRRVALSLLALALALAPVEGFARRHEGGTELLGSERRYRTRPYTYGANGEGFFERELPRAKPPGTRRIAVLGDSMTWGTTSPEEAWPRALETALGPGVQVLNFSTYGYDIRQSRATLPEALAYSPDLVLLGAYWNDHVPTRAITVGPTPFVVWLEDRGPLWRASAAWRALDGYFHRDRWDFEPERGFFERELSALAREVGAVPLGVVVLAPHALSPGVEACVAYGATRSQCELSSRLTAEVLATSRALGLRTIDATGALEAPSPPANGADWEHPGPEGQRAIGRLVARALSP